MIRVFIFDTDQSFAGEISTELEQHACDVSVFADVRRGLVEAVKKHPDLILLSADLPGTSGFTVCNKVKKSPLKQVPVILISQDGDPETIAHRQLPTRANDYVAKGISVAELIEHIQQLIPLGLSSAEQIPAGLSDVDEVLGNGPRLDDPLSTIQEGGGDLLSAEVDAAMGALFDSVLCPPSDPPMPPPATVSTAASGASAGRYDAVRAPGSGSRLPPVPPHPKPVRSHTEPGITPPPGSIPRAAPMRPDTAAIQQLDRQLSEAEDEIRSLRRQLDEREELAAKEISSLKQQIEEQEELAVGEISSLKQQIEIIQAEAAKAVTALRADLARAQDRAALALESQKQAEQQLDQARAAAAESGSLQQQLDSLRQAAAAREQELRAAQQASGAGAEQQEKIAQLERRSAELTEQLEAVTAERDQAAVRASDFRSKAKRIAEQLNMRSQELRDAEQKHREQLERLSGESPGGAGAGRQLGDAAQAQAKHAGEIEELTREHAAALEALEREGERALQDAQQQLEDELEEQNARHEAVLAEMAAEHAAELSAQQAQWADREKALLKQVADLEKRRDRRRSGRPDSDEQQQVREAHAALRRTKKALSAVVAHLEAAISEGSAEGSED